MVPGPRAADGFQPTAYIYAFLPAFLPATSTPIFRATLFLTVIRATLSLTVILSKHERALATEGASKDPEDVNTTMLIQGILPRDCPRGRISRPQFSARSCRRGFISINSMRFSFRAAKGR